jgi:hypothetical protein
MDSDGRILTHRRKIQENPTQAPLGPPGLNKKPMLHGLEHHCQYPAGIETVLKNPGSVA